MNVRIVACAMAALGLVGCASVESPSAAPVTAAPAAPVAAEAPAAPAPVPVVVAPAPPAAPALPSAFGVEFLGTKLSAADHVVDLRYRVIDAQKAAPLLDRKVKPVLVNDKTGRRYYVPQPPIVGALRQTARAPASVQVGRTYFMIFANPDRELKAGDQLALYVGDQRVGDFKLQ